MYDRHLSPNSEPFPLSVEWSIYASHCLVVYKSWVLDNVSEVTNCLWTSHLSPTNTNTQSPGDAGGSGELHTTFLKDQPHPSHPQMAREPWAGRLGAHCVRPARAVQDEGAHMGQRLFSPHLLPHLKRKSTPFSEPTPKNRMAGSSTGHFWTTALTYRSKSS